MSSQGEKDVLLELLRQVRIDANLRQSDLADLFGQPQSFVSKYESGERRLDILELRELCEHVGIAPQEFFDRLEEIIGASQRGVRRSI